MHKGLELWFNAAMRKLKAIELLGGTTASAAKEIGVSYQAVDKWPDELPARIADRVLAVLARKHLPAKFMEGLENRPTPRLEEAQEARDFVQDLLDWGLTQQEIADRSGIQQPTISKIARGALHDVLSRNWRSLQAVHRDELSKRQKDQPPETTAAPTVG